MIARIAALSVGLLIAAGGLSACSASTTKSADTSTTAAAPAAGIGNPVRDGKFEFVVTSVDRSRTAGDPNNEFLQQTAKGEFVNVHLKVTNTGDEARMFSASSQRLIIGGKKYDAASILGVSGDNENINPGLSVDTVVSFDVAPGAVPDSIELHDSMLSGGATVNLK
jgi:hypothetical protein